MLKNKRLKKGKTEKNKTIIERTIVDNTQINKNIKKSHDHFYYNVIMNNNSNLIIPASFSETRGSIILDNPSDYTVSLIRFQISTNSIPIFNFEPVSGSYTTGNTNPWLGQYKVTLEYPAGNFITENVIRNNNLYINTRPNIINWESLNSANFTIYQILTYDDFLFDINSAFARAYSRISSSAPPKLAGASAPQLIYENGIISLLVNKSYDSIFSGADSINIYMNPILYYFFNNFDVEYLNSTIGFKLAVFNNANNNIVLPVSQNDFSLWYSYNTYIIGDGVFYNGVNYLSLTNANLGNQPDTSTANWRAQYATWNMATSYNENDIVTYLGSYYLSKTAGNIAQQPDITPLSWQVTVPNTTPHDWLPSSTYTINNVVKYGDSFYISRTNANTANIPSSSVTNWQTYTAYSLYKMTQPYQSLYNWNDMVGIAFTSNTLPLVEEFTPTDLGLLTSNENQITNSNRQILTDFTIESTTGFDIKEPITYTNQGEYRLINLNSNNPLQKIDIQAYWYDTNNVFFPILLLPDSDSQVSCKLLFRRKDFNKD